MPFIGLDWRAPGEAWMKTTVGWEQTRLLPLRNPSESSLDRYSLRQRNDSDSSSSGADLPFPPISMNTSNMVSPDDLDEVEVDEVEKWQPFCFVKTGKSKEVKEIAEIFIKFLLI